MQQDLFERKRKQTVTKHNLLENYLRPWARIVGSRFRDVWYVDAFAAVGEYKSGEKGSPLIAAEILADERRRTADKGKSPSRFHVICIEKEKARAEALRKHQAHLKSVIPFEVREGEFSPELPGVIKRIGDAPAFFFLDPTGFAGMPMADVKKILDLPHKEVFINFMWNAVRRWQSSPSEALRETITQLMGTDGWQSRRDERDWLDLYLSQLRAAGCYVLWFRNKFPDKDRTFYYLVYATRNFTGLKIMKEVMFKEETREYFEPDLGHQIAFPDFVKKLEGLICADRSASQLQLLEFTLRDTHQYIEKDMRRGLRELLEMGRITKHGTGDKAVYTMAPNPGGDAGVGVVREALATPYSAQRRPSAIRTLQGVRVIYDTYQTLDGAFRTLVRQVADGSIIKRFDKTPPPSAERDVVCPHFLELKWAYGCPYDCAWCYLKGTLRFAPRGPKPTVKDFTKVRQHTEAFLQAESDPELLNTGEIADSLMCESTRHSFVNFILPPFETQEKHKVLFLTKSDRIQNLLGTPSHRQTVVSFSLNAPSVSDRWELKAPKVADRIRAATLLSRHGYEVRIRIDPLVPVERWREEYPRLLDQIFTNFTPARITLGSLRGLQSTINNCPDKSWVDFLSERSGWGRRIAFLLRSEMFATLLQALREQYDYTDLALCKETLGVWQALGMDFRHIKCNCTL